MNALVDTLGLEADYAPALDNAPVLRRLWQVWNEARAGRPVPTRDDLPPELLRSFLPWLFIAGRDPDGRWRYRLAGTELWHVNGREITGLTLEEAFADQPGRDVRLVSRAYDRVADRCQPMRSRGRAAWCGRLWMDFDCLHLPVLPFAGAPAQILGLVQLVD